MVAVLLIHLLLLPRAVPAVDPDYVLKHGDVITHTHHWHEPPVWIPSDR